ncbi:hypothetical protein EDEG_01076 [Edhazardia aedis USNM 41457]|uniref:Uncharacterized protein n=1 Tax=Edhazardia aedis (strain USNM 41457) TaxID=1003232 RepID=J8ZYJ2_EDHAE|nr:hypothetical protein EDEG_01076 [Edhazardia aedis USNM 41457]|eukprot:EJW04733.1 hypothetical protein EDEG_01076 [Edhazardia aedis USNM 41457]
MQIFKKIKNKLQQKNKSNKTDSTLKSSSVIEIENQHNNFVSSNEPGKEINLKKKGIYRVGGIPISDISPSNYQVHWFMGMFNCFTSYFLGSLLVSYSETCNNDLWMYTSSVVYVIFALLVFLCNLIYNLIKRKNNKFNFLGIFVIFANVYFIILILAIRYKVFNGICSLIKNETK